MASLLPLLPLLIIISIVSADDVNIDCGSSDSFVDERNMPWVGDDLYIGHGRSVVLKTPAAGDPVIPRPMTTLRVFDGAGSRRKSCYQIPVNGGGRVLARASFYYGNYDGKASPPSFALQFDANSWATVETALDRVVFYEAVYDVVPGVGSTSVCVARTRAAQPPFVSAIEVKSLDSDVYIYLDAGRALFLTTRVAFGARDIVRYMDDIYDRIWNPSTIPSGYRALTSDAQSINTDIRDKPPASVLETAVSPAQLAGSLGLFTNLPESSVTIYMNLYFSETSELDSTQVRSFELYIDGVHASAPISPPYGGVVECYASVAANSSTAFALRATGEATLPPLVNAMEVFVVSGALSNGTDADDVQTLALLQQQYDALQDWNGDPCLPFSYNWEWVNCSADETPRITALYLSGLGLGGILPDLSPLQSLEILDLHNNSFTGEIPDFLGNFPKLRELNLADNSFTGSVPSSLAQNSKLKLDVSGNPDLCVPGQSCGTSGTPPGTSAGGGTATTTSYGRKKTKKNKLGLALGLTLPLSFIFSVTLATVFFLRSRKNSPTIAANGQMNTNHSYPGASHHAHAVDMNNHHADEENRIQIELQKQMALQMGELVNQQAQAKQYGNNTDTNYDASNQEEQALRYQ